MALKLDKIDFKRMEALNRLENMIFFDSDDDFTDFCLAPYGVLIYDKEGSPSTYSGVYSEEYKDCIAKGMKFVIRDPHSKVYKHHCVTKRVPIQGTKETRLVQMNVQNVEIYGMIHRKYEQLAAEEE